MRVLPLIAQRAPVRRSGPALLKPKPKESSSRSVQLHIANPELVHRLREQPEHELHERERDERPKREPKRQSSPRRHQCEYQCSNEASKLADSTGDREARIVDGLNGTIRLLG